MNAAAWAAGFGALVALPLAPGLVELRRARDATPLPIDLRASRNPRGRADAMRVELGAYAEGVSRGLWDAVARGGQPLVAERGVRLAPGERAAADLVSLGDAALAERTRVQRVLVRGDADAGCEARIGALACDGGLVLRDRVRVDELIDAEDGIDAGLGCRLGASASTAGPLRLGLGSTFRRLWGHPISTGEPPAGAGTSAVLGPTIEDIVVWSRERLSLPAGFVLDRDVVARGDVRIGAGCVIHASVKAHGGIHVAPGTLVEGSLIARGDIVVEGPAEIDGNLFGERRIRLGPGTVVGREGGYKTVFCAGRALVAQGVVVHGALVAERGGVVR